MKYNLPVEYDRLPPREKRLVREQYILEQNELCWFCKKHLLIEPERLKRIDIRLFPEGFFDNPIHLQHDHYTGLTEGAVHAYCNAVLWQYHGR